ncbi:MAG: RpiB/LacA/LacB family sugar-phosphate isomerase [Candidatus Terrybacteria bacterium]|nr:RpiB/LacA/LacB family sugar-phosphate isomerase [Candidatus Terrybacteria bacterium]
MKVFLGADHAGFALKEEIKRWLVGQGYEVEDKGAFSLDSADDYPDFVAPVARAVAEDPKERRGIVLGGSGQGEAMVANRFAGVRAAVYYGGPTAIIQLSREHNDANILALGARFVSEAEAIAAVGRWLATLFSGDERHVRRIGKIASDTVA